MNKIVNSENELAVAQVHALSHDGRGIATVNHKTLFIRGALPEETIAYKIISKRSRYAEAEMHTLIHASKERVLPICDHFGLCGGCSLQHMSEQAQLALKEKTLLDQLNHFGKIIPENIIPPLSAKGRGYRRKARLGVKFVYKKNKVLVGFREKSSRYLAELNHCVVLHESIGERFSALRDVITSLESFQAIPQIEVAVGDKDTALVFRHLVALSISDQEKLIRFGEKHHFHIYLQPESHASVYKLWPPNTKDRLSYSLPKYQLEFLFHPLDFTQIHWEMNQLMVDQALSLLDVKPDESVLDLFCGIGNFSLPLARLAAFVTGIEGDTAMVARAQENAAHNKITNVDFYAANLDDANQQGAWVHRSYDKLLLDPPRTGAKAILSIIDQLAPKRIIYVSCNPATLARDAGDLVHLYGYKLSHVGIMNMFPHTSHIEAIAQFDKS